MHSLRFFGAALVPSKWRHRGAPGHSGHPRSLQNNRAVAVATMHASGEKTGQRSVKPRQRTLAETVGKPQKAQDWRREPQLKKVDKPADKMYPSSKLATDGTMKKRNLRLATRIHAADADTITSTTKSNEHGGPHSHVRRDQGHSHKRPLQLCLPPPKASSYFFTSPSLHATCRRWAPLQAIPLA